MDKHIEITIDGKKISNFEKFKIKQKIQDHHRFTVWIDKEEAEKIRSNTIDGSLNWVNKSLHISLIDSDFLGVITKVQLGQSNGSQGLLVVTGYSKTYVLEGGKTFRSWSNLYPENIIEKLIANKGLLKSIQPKTNKPLSYQCQHNETDYAFLKRMASNYYEWLYYDGVVMHYGRPKSEKEIDIAYGQDIYDLQIGVELKGTTKTMHNYDQKYGAMETSTTIEQEQYGQNYLSYQTFKASKTLFPTPTITPAPVDVDNSYELERMLEKDQNSIISGMHTISGVTKDKRLKIGSVLNIISLITENNKTTKEYYGRYIIVKLHHMGTGKGAYQNKFTAIPRDFEVPPILSKVKPLKLYPQLGVVTSNDDPKQMGRVKARYYWGEEEVETDWMRVITPDAGVGQIHQQNRGFTFIPEVGDEIQISYMYGDPNRPSVSGSLFSGKTSQGGKQDNNYKSIITRSGHKLEFNDTKDRESILITDKNQNVIFIDTANSSIRISAPEHLNLSAKNIAIAAKENLSIGAGENMGVNAGKSMTVGAGENMNLNANKELQLLAKSIVEKASEGFTTEASNIEEQAEKIVKDSNKEGVELNSLGAFQNSTGSSVKLF